MARNRDNSRQVPSAEEFIGTGAWVSVLALAETTGVLSNVYALTAKQQATAIEMLLNHRHLVLEDPDLVVAARKAGHLPLGAFDRNLARVEGTKKL